MAEGYSSPDVDRASVRSLAAFAEARLQERLANYSMPPVVSVETMKGIVKRVTPKLVADFSKVDKLPFLISMELEMLGDRIRLYPFTALYREAINWASKDMIAAWMLHSHSLRQGELYIIQERGVELLRFLRDVGTNLGLPAADRSKYYEKAFKKRFERRLRERHRIVHAHERPSLTSRVIDFGVAAQEADNMVAETLADLVIKIAHMLPGDTTDDPEELLRRVHELRDSYANFAREEAADMLEMLATEVGNTLGIAFVAQSTPGRS
jgi:hypothetical protein